MSQNTISEFDIYCDESRLDLLCSKKADGHFMVIGGLWLKKEKRDEFKKEIHALRDKFKIGGEFKWQKVSPSREKFYESLIDWFVKKNDELRFRCIAVECKKVDLLKYHQSDQELGFYKFYYQLLHHWILDFNTYSIFIDFKSNRRRDRLQVLQQCLQNSNLSAVLTSLQPIRSDESVLMQLCDVLTGIASAKLNQKDLSSSAKKKVIKELEKKLGRPITKTPKGENKFNVFKIDLDGAW